MVMARARAYLAPPEDVRPLHFAYTCAFGLKEPIFSGEHLQLCEDRTLLLHQTEPGPGCTFV